MPGLDGLEVLKFLSESKTAAEICLISGRNSGLLRSAHKLGQALGLKMSAPLSKPLSMRSIEGFLNTGRKLQGSNTKPPHEGSGCIAEIINEPLVVDVSSEDIEKAIADQEILPFYQAIVNLKTGELASLEALCRWEHPKLGRILPNAFLPKVVEHGHMDSMTTHLVDYTLDDMRCWDSMGIMPNVSLNLCPSSLSDDVLIETLISKVKGAGIQPSRICFEITEEDDCCASNETVKNICRLRLAGFNLALDDFGTGYASLDKLRSIPFSMLKIDRQFVFPLTSDVDALAIVNSAISLANEMGIAVVAEGIEDKETATWLLERGCALGQGYYFGEPQDFNQAISTIKKKQDMSLVWPSER
jgi:EAL domain-containing protein (putative c-di-GMP-specific phosphodiesterase class I)